MKFITSYFNIPFKVSFLFSIISLLIYTVVFIFAYEYAGPSIAALALLPILVISLFYNVYISLVASLFIFPLNIILFLLAGESLTTSLQFSLDPGGLLFPITALILGGLRASLQYTQKQHLILQEEINRRIQLEIQLVTLKEEAEEANKHKSLFFANMSHEFRTPLTAIIGYSELLEEQNEEDQEIMPVLGKIILSAKQLLNLINDILDFSKLEAGKVQIQNTTFSVNDLIEDVIVMSAPLIEKNNNAFIPSIEPNLGAMYTDPTKLKQVLLNLLSNAGKFTKNGEVHFRVFPNISNEVDSIVFQVEDTGIGMNAPQLQKISQPFVQADLSTTKQYGGTGLGLSITYHLVEIMGGSIEVSSEPSQGSTFTVKIPLNLSTQVSH